MLKATEYEVHHYAIFIDDPLLPPANPLKCTGYIMCLKCHLAPNITFHLQIVAYLCECTYCHHKMRRFFHNVLNRMAFLIEMHCFLFGMTEFLNVITEFLFLKAKMRNILLRTLFLKTSILVLFSSCNTSCTSKQNKGVQTSCEENVLLKHRLATLIERGRKKVSVEAQIQEEEYSFLFCCDVRET